MTSDKFKQSDDIYLVETFTMKINRLKSWRGQVFLERCTYLFCPHKWNMRGISNNDWREQVDRGFFVSDLADEATMQLTANDCFQLPLSVFTVTDERLARYNWHSFPKDCSGTDARIELACFGDCFQVYVRRGIYCVAVAPDLVNRTYQASLKLTKCVFFYRQTSDPC